MVFSAGGPEYEVTPLSFLFIFEMSKDITRVIYCHRIYMQKYRWKELAIVLN